jgi:hypothetical protein
MKKKHYEKPSLEVVVLNQQTALLAGSVQATQENYDDGGEEEW